MTGSAGSAAAAALLCTIAPGLPAAAQEPFFPISYWAGPPREHSTDETYADIAAANFTLAFNGDLDLSQRHGLKCMVFDGRVAGVRPAGAETDAAMDAVVAEHRDHPALWGYYLQDEPHSSAFASLAYVNQGLLRRDPAHTPYINLFPNYATTEQLGNETYEEHVAQFCETVKPRALSYDHYALLDGGDRPEYFGNMEVIRQAGLRHDIPFWFILQVTAHGPYRVVNEAELRWQVYTALAYGAKGIMYFTYWLPAPDERWNWHDAIVERDGSRNAHYDMVQRINGEVKALGPMLLRLKSIGAHHAEPLPEGTKGLQGARFVAALEGGPAVIGEHVDDVGRKFVFLVNRDYAAAHSYTITFDREEIVCYEVSKETGQMAMVETEPSPEGLTLTLTVAPGDGRLLSPWQGE